MKAEWIITSDNNFLFSIVEEAGGKALPCIVDVRDENQVRSAIKSAVDKV